MVDKIPALSFFQIRPTTPVEQGGGTQSVKRVSQGYYAGSEGNPSGASYAGINENIKFGDTVYGQKQAGITQGGIAKWIA